MAFPSATKHKSLAMGEKNCQSKTLLLKFLRDVSDSLEAKRMCVYGGWVVRKWDRGSEGESVNNGSRTIKGSFFTDQPSMAERLDLAPSNDKQKLSKLARNINRLAAPV